MHLRSASLDEAGIRAALNANWTNNMQKTMASTYDQDTMEIIKLDGTSPTQTFAGVGNSSGQGNDQVVPQVATIISLRSLQRGPQGRGRLFLPAVAENMQNNGRLDPTNLALQQTAWEDFIDAMSLDSADLVVASYTHSAAYLVTSVIAQPVTGTQKRRIDRLRVT
jgi:hypothetical protein